ncbi:MAG TPA: hypothetical protein VEA59_05340 [Patescibacteria group bacterium]|nr:hypothetical protein [Patescibacteria group bacterium]
MNNSITNKNVSIGGKIIITDWRNARVVSPENLQEKIQDNENAKKEIQKQKEVYPIGNSIVTD